MKNWLINNLSNLFGIIGIAVTVYFSVFYVPSWISESQNEKVNNATQEIVQSIKELVFSETVVNISEIQSLVIAKEIEKKIRIPHSIFEILAITEDSYMEDKFLPLQQRRDLINEIEILKNQLPAKEDRIENLQKSNFSGLTILGYVIGAIIGILILLLGGYGLFFSYRNKQQQQEKITNQEEEISNEINQASTDINSSEYYLKLEKNFIEVLRKVKDVEVVEPNYGEFGYDVLLRHRNEDIFVEFKLLTNSKVGLVSFRRFADFVASKGKKGIFFYNTDLTEMVKREIQNLKDKGIDIEVIKVKSEDELRDKVNQILQTKSSLADMKK